MLLLLGRGWQLFFWDVPLRAILWNEDLLSGVVESLFGMTWSDWARSSVLDNGINIFSRLLGVFYLFLGALCFKIERYRYLWRLLPLATVTLIFIFGLSFVAKFFYIGMLIEHAIQAFTPLLFYVYLRSPSRFKHYRLGIKIMISATFIGHGLFAFGFHPVPGHFVDMIIVVLGCSNQTALAILKVAGSLDIITSIAIFVPQLTRFCLFFMIPWGIATAFARIVTHINFNLLQETTHQWLAETVYRLPHGLIPLILYLLLFRDQESENIT